jgi:GTP-binding protein EngB required for normal cell division
VSKDPKDRTSSARTSAQATARTDEASYLEGTASARRKYGRFNLAIIGATGVGKSSLVNAVFGRDTAKVGKGLPVTTGVNYYHDASLGLWDIEGFEIGTALSPSETLREHLRTIAARPDDEQISVVWYCVLSTADRLTPADIAMINELDHAGYPVVLVLTKVAWTRNPLTGKVSAPEDVEEFRTWLENPVDREGSGSSSPPRRARTGRVRGTASVTFSTTPSTLPRSRRRTRFASRSNSTFPGRGGSRGPWWVRRPRRPRWRRPRLFRWPTRSRSRRSSWR